MHVELWSFHTRKVTWPVRWACFVQSRTQSCLVSPAGTQQSSPWWQGTESPGLWLSTCTHAAICTLVWLHCQIQHWIRLHSTPMPFILTLLMTSIVSFWSHFAESCRATNTHPNQVHQCIFEKKCPVWPWLWDNDLQDLISFWPDHRKYLFIYLFIVLIKQCTRKCVRFGWNPFIASSVTAITIFFGHHRVTLTFEPMVFPMS